MVAFVIGNMLTMCNSSLCVINRFLGLPLRLSLVSHYKSLIGMRNGGWSGTVLPYALIMVHSRRESKDHRDPAFRC